MNEIWLSIKSWSQRLILAALVIYAGLFIYYNSGDSVKIWFWFRHEHVTTVFLLTAGAFVAGMIFTVVSSAGIKTVKQIRDLRSRGRHEKIERDLAEMKAKAAMLQTRPVSDLPTGKVQ